MGFSASGRHIAVKLAGRMRIPDRWLDYSPIGIPINGQRIIAFKTPLSYDYNVSRRNPNGLERYYQFTPEDLYFSLRNQGRFISLVVDLTNTTRYYSGQRDFEDYGIGYYKLACRGHVVPEPSVVQEFKDVINRFVSNNQNPEDVVGVHCTHGVNRTGYLICRYLIDECGVPPADAIKMFEQSRGHSIERQAYIDALKINERNENEEFQDRQ